MGNRGLSTVVRLDRAQARMARQAPRKRQRAGEEAARLAPRVRQLIASQSYVQADEDAAFHSLPREQFPNPYLTPELCFRFHYFAIRKLHLLERAKAAVFFPGGYGTCDELFEVLTLLQTGKIAPIPVLLVGETWWRSVIDIDAMAEAGMIDPADLALFRYCESAGEIRGAIHNWYGED